MSVLNTMSISNKLSFHDFISAENKFYFNTSDLQNFNSVNHYNFEGDPAIYMFNNFTVNMGHIVTVTNRNRGLYLYINGDCTINGTLTMSHKGAYRVPGKDIIIDKNTLDKPSILYVDNLKTFIEKYELSQSLLETYIPSYSNYFNQSVLLRSTGFGSHENSPAQTTQIYLQNSRGTSFCGGSGAASSYGGGGPPEPNGGNGGSSAYGANGATNGGGLLILFVKGKLKINGLISSNGSDGLPYSIHLEGHPSGGGSVNIFCNNIDTQSINKIQVKGGNFPVSGNTFKSGTITISNF